MKTTLFASWDSNQHSFEKTIGPDKASPEYAILNSTKPNAKHFLLRLEEQRRDESITQGVNDVAVFMRDGMCILVNQFVHDGYARVHPDELERLCHWWIAIKESPDFKNPDAEFEPIEIEYDLDIPDELHPDFTFAVYIAEERFPSGDWVRANKIDDLNAVYVWEPDGKKRSMIVSYDEIDQDLQYPDRCVLGSEGTTFEELHAAFTAGLRT